MSTTYSLRGTRWIRPYRASTATTTTSAGSDAAGIAENLCRCDWIKASPSSAGFPSYSDSDANEASRQNFDAAEWCANHDTKAKTHRVFAQAAVYRFFLPAAARALTLESVSFNVTCDPYTPQGARVAAMCTSSDDIPTDCATLRTMTAHDDGVAKRTATTNSDGDTYWYEKTEAVTLDLDETGGKWLLIFVGLEDYRARNGWFEGAAKIASVTATFSGDVTGWSTTGTVDCRSSGSHSYPVCAGGILPDITGDKEQTVRTSVQLNGDVLPDSVTDDDGALSLALRADLHDTIAVANSAIGLRLAFANLYTGKAAAVAGSGETRLGARFVVRRRSVDRTFDLAQSPVQVPVWEIESTALSIPFACPTDFKASRIRLDWSGWAGAPTSGYLFHVWLLRGAASTDAVQPTCADFYDWRGDVADDFTHVGTIDDATGATSKTFELAEELDCRIATLLITCYQSMDGIDPSAAGTLWGCETYFKPDVTLVD